MIPRIERLPEMKLVGHFVKMSLANDRTFELWSTFMPKRRLIAHVLGANLYSLQVYSELPDMKNFSPDMVFEKWAAVEVNVFVDYKENFKNLVLEGGLYAVFVHKGRPSDFQRTLKAIHYDWLPSSGYELDNRPHFEILGDKYKNDHPDSEEEVWVPIKRIPA